MKLHRFYVGNIADKNGPLALNNNIWINENRLLKQWTKVLRFRVGEKLILFNQQSERMYEITKFEQPASVSLKAITDIDKILPSRHLTLFWAILKNDKNSLVLQKATELGVKEFVPVISERCDNKNFDIDRAQSIIIEASEQCGRFDIPLVKEPMDLKEVLAIYDDMSVYVCEAGDYKETYQGSADKIGVLVGPEGGWSEDEKKIFLEKNLVHINLSRFTLRAETASIVAASKLLQ